VRSKIASPIVGLALAVIASGVARAATITGPTLTSDIAGSIVSGLGFQALDNSMLTGFTFRNQGTVDTIVLTNSTGSVLDSIATPDAIASSHDRSFRMSKLAGFRRQRAMRVVLRASSKSRS
jgi:hypothetical protein